MADQEVNKKTIDDYKTDYYYFTGKASDISRSLAFAGIAVIWIFKITVKDTPTIPEELVAPLFWLVIALALDLFQYIVGGIIWWGFYRYHEWLISKKKLKAKKNLKAPEILPLIIHIIYWGKILSNIYAYILLLSYLYDVVII